jgi:hypothetical protein
MANRKFQSASSKCGARAPAGHPKNLFNGVHQFFWCLRRLPDGYNGPLRHQNTPMEDG